MHIHDIQRELYVKSIARTRDRSVVLAVLHEACNKPLSLYALISIYQCVPATAPLSWQYFMRQAQKGSCLSTCGLPTMMHSALARVSATCGLKIFKQKFE